MNKRNLIRYYKALLECKGSLDRFSGYGAFDPEFLDLHKQVLKEVRRVEVALEKEGLTYEMYIGSGTT